MPRQLVHLAVVAILSAFLGAGGRANLAAGPQSPAPPAGQTASQEQTPPQPTFRAGINFVRVDVIVTDNRGNPVTDLTATDFEVFEDGKPQTVESFKLVNLSEVVPGASPPREIRSAYDQESEAARDDVRLIVIFLDDYHVRRGASMGVRDPLTGFIETQLSPSDLVGVAYPLTPVSDIMLTRNHASIASAISRFDGRKFDYTPRNEFEQQYANYPTETVEKIRNQVSLSGLKAVVTHLAGLREGRKTVIVVSEGYTDLLPPQMRDRNAQLPGYDNPNRNNPTAGLNDPREETARFLASMDLLEDMRSVYAAANRANTALYTLDPRGLAPFEFDINEGVGFQTDQSYLRSTQDTLRILADQTDGRAIVGRNDLDAGLKQVVRDSGTYYLLGYNSSDSPSDGQFHEIKVRVKRSGLQVRARKGYWALTAEETARAVAPARPGPPPEVDRALSDLARQGRARTVRTWVGTSLAEGGRTKVMFVWEPVASAPGAAADVAARVSLTAVGPDGAPYFRGRVPDVMMASTDRPGAGGGASAGSAPFQAVFDARPGRVQMRLTIEGSSGESLGNEVQEIEVPDFTVPQVTLTTPRIHRGRNALEVRAILNDPDAVPHTGREFRRTDRLIVRFEAYGPGGGQPTATARLLNRAGQPMSDLPITVSPVNPGGSQIDLPLAGLAAGDYLLEIGATAPAGRATDLVAFRLAS